MPRNDHPVHLQKQTNIILALILLELRDSRDARGERPIREKATLLAKAGYNTAEIAEILDTTTSTVWAEKNRQKRVVKNAEAAQRSPEEPVADKKPAKDELQFGDASWMPSLYRRT